MGDRPVRPGVEVGFGHHPREAKICRYLFIGGQSDLEIYQPKISDLSDLIYQPKISDLSA